MTLDQEFARYQGQSVLVPGQPESLRGQCFMWFDFVLHDVYGYPYFYAQGAIDIWNNPGWLLTHFDKITDGTIKKGDIVVFNQAVGSIYGHVDIAMQDGTIDNFTGSDQNWGGNKTVHPVNHVGRQYVLGSLRLKGGNMQPPQPTGLNDNGIKAIWAAVFRGQLDGPSQADLDYWRGKPWDVCLDTQMATSAAQEVTGWIEAGKNPTAAQKKLDKIKEIIG